MDLDSRQVIFKYRSSPDEALAEEKKKFAKAREEKRESGFIIDDYGNKQWLDYFGELHRDDDLPATIYSNGSKEWYCHGELHRSGDRPAVENYKGYKSWHMFGELHRDGDHPAVIWPDGFKQYYKFGKLHRDNDQPAEIMHTHTAWYYKGELHRDEGPAYIDKTLGSKSWYQRGKVHRDPLKGPAVIYSDGFCECWENGEQVFSGTEEEYLEFVESRKATDT